ncbi:MAG TPA: glycosyltransferase family 4 protein [Rhizomicrobium sp.]|nr:glycosyltransferase family 4 protein [Rhizomicrobium sp.]
MHPSENRHVMKILTVSHFYEDHGGGIERIAAQLCRQFARDGHKPAWAASDADPPPRTVTQAIPLRCVDPIEASTGLPMPIPGPSAVRSLARAIGNNDFVVVHDALYLTSVVALILAKMRGKPVVLIQHIAEIPFASNVKRRLMRLANFIVARPMMRAADRLVFISSDVRREMLGDPARRNSMLLYYGVDTSIFHRDDPRNRCPVRIRHGLPADEKVALFVGRFVEKKGISVIEAIARHRPDLHIAMVGNGPVRPESWDLPNVHILGPQSQQTIAELYGAADLLLLPSVGEGYPLVIQEAMACALPVVCGDQSARADPCAARWLRGVDINLADPAGSALRCVTAIDGLDRNPDDCAEMALYAEKTYSWPTMARAIVLSLSGSIESAEHATGSCQPV